MLQLVERLLPGTQVSANMASAHVGSHLTRLFFSYVVRYDRSTLIALHMLLFRLAGRYGGSSWGLPRGNARLAAVSSHGTFAPASRFEVGCKLANAWSAQPRRETGSHSKRSSIGYALL